MSFQDNRAASVVLYQQKNAQKEDVGENMAILFVFLDGVGLAPAGADNPLTDAPTPALRALLGGPLVIETARLPQRPGLLLRPIDATLGVEGTPQSGTGQTAMLAGVNAPALHGRHQPHVPPVALRPVLAERSILRRVVDAGGRATFANAFTPGYWEALATRRVRRSASVIAAEGAGLAFRTAEDLRRGQALSWDITGAALRAAGLDIPSITPQQAGAALAALAHDHDLVFYENFMTDLAGHGRLTMGLGQIFGLIDALLGAALEHMRPQDTLVLTSDHGNVESLSAPNHTRNPVPLLAVGPDAQRFAQIEDLSQLADGMMDVISSRR